MSEPTNWICNCGAYIENAFHCPSCGAEPPWGCPCESCESVDEEDEGMSFWEKVGAFD